jgi:hypothetical protein
MKRSSKKHVWFFGNPDLPSDAIPLQLKDRLMAAFPSVHFEQKDPLDEWEDVPDPLIIIDTVKGIEAVTVFRSIDEFQKAPSITMHDYDLGTHLLFLKKLGKLPALIIIGVPPMLPNSQAFSQIQKTLEEIILRC